MHAALLNFKCGLETRVWWSCLDYRFGSVLTRTRSFGINLYLNHGHRLASSSYSPGNQLTKHIKEQTVRLVIETELVIFINCNFYHSNLNP